MPGRRSETVGKGTRNFPEVQFCTTQFFLETEQREEKGEMYIELDVG